jgi:hypothetical protein
MSIFNLKASWDKVMNRASLGLRQGFKNAGAPKDPARQDPKRPPVEPVMSADEAAETWFGRLRDLFVMEFGPAPFELGNSRYLIESGMLDSDRPYVYLQPLNRQGFLFERASSGWVIGRADKIVANDTFVRTGEAWDVVNVVSQPDAAMPKVVSRRFEDQSMPFSEYRRRLLEAVRCAA